MRYFLSLDAIRMHSKIIANNESMMKWIDVLWMINDQHVIQFGTSDSNQHGFFGVMELEESEVDEEEGDVDEEKTNEAAVDKKQAKEG